MTHLSLRRRPPGLVCCDLDGTLLHGGPEAEARFRAFWSSLSQATRPILVYNSGRTVENMRALMRSGRLPEAEHCIGAMGTEYWGRSPSRDATSEAFLRRFGAAWDLERVEHEVSQLEAVERQSSEFCNPWKSSWYWPEASASELAALRTRIAEAGVQAHVIYSGRRFLDVLPVAAGKGSALTWLLDTLGLPTMAALVAGDSGNDSAMFTLAGVRRVLVANADADLRAEVAGLPHFLAPHEGPDGVIAGLEHEGLACPPGRPRVGA